MIALVVRFLGDGEIVKIDVDRQKNGNGVWHDSTCDLELSSWTIHKSGDFNDKPRCNIATPGSMRPVVSRDSLITLGAGVDRDLR